MADSLLQPGSNLDQEGPNRVLAAPLGPADGELIFSLASSQHEGASGEAVVITEHCLFSSTTLRDGGDLGQM